ncbi:hypothetical protein LIER_20338 [Lithospermum erythrorhizon]|uniref:Uncharacterized protein n=1 Tax=Lithospermum erythrorhizon TaxID=34254 RepID=A0AAV3QM77_LITER
MRVLDEALAEMENLWFSNQIYAGLVFPDAGPGRPGVTVNPRLEIRSLVLHYSWTVDGQRFFSTWPGNFRELVLAFCACRSETYDDYGVQFSDVGDEHTTADGYYDDHIVEDDMPDFESKEKIPNSIDNWKLKFCLNHHICH